MQALEPRAAALSRLRRKIERLGTAGAERQTLAFGIEAIDRALPGGGLALGAVHEITEQGTDGARASLSALFAAGILARLPRPVIWCLHSRDLFAPALARVGLHPDRLIYCETWKDADVLPAMEEGPSAWRPRGCSRRACALAADAVAPAATGSGSVGSDRLRAAALGQRIGRSQCVLLALADFPHLPGRWSIWTWDVPAGASIFCAAAVRKPTPLLWRPAMRRVVSLFLPSWATDRLRRRNGGLPQPEVPLITAMQDGNQRVIAAVDEAARRLKLRPGMTIAHAQSLVPGLHIHDAMPHEDEAALARLAL
jgi:hypothetical protein